MEETSRSPFPRRDMSTTISAATFGHSNQHRFFDDSSALLYIRFRYGAYGAARPAIVQQMVIRWNWNSHQNPGNSQIGLRALEFPSDYYFTTLATLNLSFSFTTP